MPERLWIEFQGMSGLYTGTASATHMRFMVSVAQLAERRIVDPVVVGSSPIAHPNYFGYCRMTFHRAVSSAGRAGDS